MRLEFVAGPGRELLLYADCRSTLLAFAPDFEERIRGGITEPTQPCWLEVTDYLPHAIAGNDGILVRAMAPAWWREMVEGERT